MKPIVLIATLNFKPEFTPEALLFLTALHAKTHANDEGCLQYDLHVSNDDENTFIFIETWASEALLETHSNTVHVKELHAFVSGKIKSISVQKMTKIL